MQEIAETAAAQHTSRLLVGLLDVRKVATVVFHIGQVFSNLHFEDNLDGQYTNTGER